MLRTTRELRDRQKIRETRDNYKDIGVYRNKEREREAMKEKNKHGRERESECTGYVCMYV